MLVWKLSGVMMCRKSSEGLLDIVDDLVEKFDCFGDILEEIDQKYSEVFVFIIFRRIINIKWFMMIVINNQRFVI